MDRRVAVVSDRHAGYPVVVTRPPVLDVLLQQHGTTFAEEAGIVIRDEPAPLWQLLVLTLLLSTRIRSQVAVAAAHELFAAGCRTPEATRHTSRGSRIAALGRAGYRRYDERTATRLHDLAGAVSQTYDGDLRRLPHAGAAELEQALQQFAGIGPVGAAIFCREVQAVWPGLAPYLDPIALGGAGRLGLPDSADELADLVAPGDLPRLAAACVRAARSTTLVAEVRELSRAPR